MAVSTSDPLCQPCAYHEAFKGESLQHTLFCFVLFVFLLKSLLLSVLNCTSGGVRPAGRRWPLPFSPSPPSFRGPVGWMTYARRFIGGCGSPVCLCLSKMWREEGDVTGGRPAGFQFAVCVPSGATGEETSDARPAEPGAGGSGDAVSLWAAGPPHQGADAAGRADLRDCWQNSHMFPCHVSPQFFVSCSRAEKLDSSQSPIKKWLGPCASPPSGNNWAILEAH